jgi:KDO2-lipid IV(A) lauroyltransferase
MCKGWVRNAEVNKWVQFLKKYVRMRAMKKALSYLYYLLVAMLWNMYRLLPVSWAYRMGWGVGAGLFALCRRSKRARVAINNVIIAGLAKTRADAYLIARDSLGHFAGLECEAIRASDVVTRENWKDYVALEMTPASYRAIFENKEPVILATGHLGSWEAGITAITSARPMLAVARLMDNPYIQAFLERHNFRGGATIIPKKNGFSGDTLRRWQSANAALTILFDQFSSRGVPVSFFGQTVPVFTSPARLSYKTGRPVVVGGFLRTGLLKYKMVAIGDPIVPDLTKPHDEAIRELTAEYISRLEQVIRMAPDQYLWMHRRFRGIPVPQVPEK